MDSYLIVLRILSLKYLEHQTLKIHQIEYKGVPKCFNKVSQLAINTKIKWLKI